MERFPISFKTQFNGNIHRHVVLGVYHAGRYGALGMSRRDDLMYKPLVYKVIFNVHVMYTWQTGYSDFLSNFKCSQTMSFPQKVSEVLLCVMKTDTAVKIING